MGAPVLITAPGVPAVTLAEAKAHLRVEFSEDDGLISAYIAAAISVYDGWRGVLGRCLIDQVWEITLPSFPACGVIPLPFPDVSACEVKYYAVGGVLTVLDTARYRLSEAASGSRVALAEGASWPETDSRPDAVVFRFTAGFGASATDIPAMIRQGILIEVASLYLQREGGGKSGEFMDRVVAQFGRVFMGASRVRNGART